MKDMKDMKLYLPQELQPAGLLFTCSTIGREKKDDLVFTLEGA